MGRSPTPCTGPSAGAGGAGAHVRPAGARYSHPILARSFQPDPGPIADHIREDVGTRISDLIDQLLADSQRRHQATGPFRLGHDELTIGLDLHDGKAHVVEAGHLLPVREVPPCALRATFDDVACQRARRQAVVVFLAPTELRHERPEYKRGIGAAPRHHNIGAGQQGIAHRQRTQVGIHRHQAARHFGAGVHVHAVGELSLARQ